MIVFNLYYFSQTDFMRQKTKKLCCKEQPTSIMTTQASQEIIFWEQSVEMSFSLHNMCKK